jgi:hypothetical protein
MKTSFTAGGQALHLRVGWHDVMAGEDFLSLLGKQKIAEQHGGIGMARTL